MVCTQEPACADSVAIIVPTSDRTRQGFPFGRPLADLDCSSASREFGQRPADADPHR